MTQLVGTCRAHANIALIKYWGKEDEELFIPMNSSLSLTLAALYTDTRVSFDSALTEDHFYLDGVKQGAEEVLKLTQFLDLFRQKAGSTAKACVESYNHVPTAAGLASSASAYAALAGACRDALALDLSDSELSTFARRGSGSATRSIFGGFVKWEKGQDHSSSRAYPLPVPASNYSMVIALVNAGKKAMSSRAGMAHTRKTSPYYTLWPRTAEKQCQDLERALAAEDFMRVGEIMESNAMRMHATMLASDPVLSYFQPGTMEVIQAVQKMRAAGISAYYTMDAGPNVKILCQKKDQGKVVSSLKDFLAPERIIPTEAGPGIHSLEAWPYEKH